MLNSLFYVNYTLPGVFENNIYPNAVNGSLWTLPAEVLMYVLIPVLFSLFGYKKSNCSNHKKMKIFWSVITLVLISFQLYIQYNAPESRLVIYAPDWFQVLTIITYYFIGILCALFNIKKF